MVLLTKVDVLYNNLSIDVSEIYESKDVRRAAEDVCEMLGVKLNTVFPIRNYDNETCVNKTMDAIILGTFKKEDTSF